MTSSRLKFLVLGTLVGLVVLAGPVACDENTAVRERDKIAQLYNNAVEAHDTELAAYLQVKLAEADATIAKAKIDPVAPTVESIQNNPLVDLIPAPLRTPLVLGLGLFASIWRGIRWKNAATSIAKSIEKLPDTTKWDDPLTMTTLDANQTPAAKVAVDLAQGKKVSLIDRII